MIETGKYQHYKGNFYEVIGVATHSETEEKLVVYKPLYGEQNLWVRPLSMFTQEIIINNIKQARFKKVLE